VEIGLKALDGALNAVDSVVLRENAKDDIQLLTARIDVLRFQLYIINEALASVVRAALPAQTAEDMATTRIGDRDIEVKPGPRSAIYFSRGWGADDPRGTIAEFWTAATADDNAICTGRSPVGVDPGDRFRWTEHRPSERAYWVTVCNDAAYIRPAKREEVEDWLTERIDAPFAGDGIIGGKPVKVVKEGERYKLMDKT
jgi:hypothetical protein